VELVKDLVVSHIKGKCLILVALPMTGISSRFEMCACLTRYLRFLADDIDNQIALRLARREDPEGRRTIGSPFFFGYLCRLS
jgi:hypothetical protein